jgi:thiol-disulfide isomerase/thioredoxin
MCLTFILTRESFCATSCATSTPACPAATYSCEDIPISETESSKQCVPKGQDARSCLEKLSPTMEVGDIMDDFAMVGYVDTEGDGFDREGKSEPLQVVHLSDFKDKKLILFNLAAGWCKPCKLETSGKDYDSGAKVGPSFLELMQKYGPQGLVVFQVLFDSKEPGVTPDKDFLDLWTFSALRPVGAVGIDPGQLSVTYNTAGSTPMNMFLDASTRKVLSKDNGSTGIEDTIKSLLGTR